MHEGTCTIRTSPSTFWQKKSPVLILIITWHSYFCWYSAQIAYSKREPFRLLPPLRRHVVLLNGGNCRHKMHVAKGRGALDLLSGCSDAVEAIQPQCCLITMTMRTSLRVMLFISTSIDHRSSCLWSQWLEWKARCHTRDFLKLGICTLNKSTAMEKMMLFPPIM